MKERIICIAVSLLTLLVPCVAFANAELDTSVDEVIVDDFYSKHYVNHQQCWCCKTKSRYYGDSRNYNKVVCNYESSEVL